jgi:ADP-ribose pyrophosphatase YjhB (NUDIX family)
MCGLKRGVRALILHNGDVTFMRRTPPGQAPYLTTVGGSVENTDADLAAALLREIAEEIGGTITGPVPVFLHTDLLPGGGGVQHFFAATLLDIDLTARTGSEFAKPERGDYKLVRALLTARGLVELNASLLPAELAARPHERRRDPRRDHRPHPRGRHVMVKAPSGRGAADDLTGPHIPVQQDLFVTSCQIFEAVRA